MGTLDPKATTIARHQKWQEFGQFIDRFQTSNWIFRGVSDAINHKLIPKIGREDKFYDLATERVIFANFQRRCRQFVDTRGFTAWEYLTLGQHHGLPTRLLDWSTNPLIAAYFAVTSQPKATTARIYVAKAPRMADTTALVDPFECDQLLAFVPAAVAPRIVSQRGLFTVHHKPTEEWDRGVSIVRPAKHTDPSWFDIPEDMRGYFERKLFQLGVDPAAIKADLDGVCDTLAWQFARKIAVGRFNY